MHRYPKQQQQPQSTLQSQENESKSHKDSFPTSDLNYNDSYFILAQFYQSQMHLSMRYPTAKLAQMTHNKHSYQQHKNQISKIMNKSSHEFIRRSSLLDELKSRKLQAYNHSQNLRKNEIGQVNTILFTKIYKSKLNEKEDLDQSLEEIQQKLQLRQAQNQTKPQSPRSSRFILKNHRQTPITKLTLLERTRQNIRLAKKIVQPVITYRTSEYQKLHFNAKALKQRIMRYEPTLALKKADLYVSKKLNLSSISLDRKKSSSSIKSISSELNNPEHPLFPQKKGSPYLKSKI